MELRGKGKAMDTSLGEEESWDDGEEAEPKSRGGEG